MENHLSYFYLKQHNRRAAFWFVFVCLLRQYQIQSRLTWTSVYIELLILQLLFPSAETTDVRLHTYTAAHVSCVYMCGREYTCTCTGEKTTSCVIRYHLTFPSWDRETHSLVGLSIIKKTKVAAQGAQGAACLCPPSTGSSGANHWAWILLHEFWRWNTGSRAC